MEPASVAATATTHPLEPLAGAEIAAAAEILRRERDLPETTRFVFIVLREPDKALVRDWTPEAEVPREADVTLRDRATGATMEAVVSLTEERVTAFAVLAGVQAPITAEEFLACEDVVRADPDWQAAMRLRGVDDWSLAMIDPWAASHTGPGDHPDARRICRPLTWVRTEPGDNGYARPVEGLLVTVDLDLMQVVEVVDHGAVPLPPQPGNYDPRLTGAAERPGVKALEITQPDGPSFTVDGHLVTWLGWHLRVGFAPREGLILHQVGFEQHGELRPVLYRASLSEMWVPYGDPAPTHRHKNVFDMGEYGVGWLANPLELGCDCLGEIHYFDGIVNDQDGGPVVIPNAVCLHEEDYGIGWKHTDFRTNEVEVRRLRRLVISTIATVGNYEYGYFWYLYSDGGIEYEVKLTGILSTGAVAPGERPGHGVLLAPGLYGPHHQHFFCVRMDMEVDGPANRVVETDSEPLPAGPDNPSGNAWVTRSTVLGCESEAQRIIDPLKGRSWSIQSAERVNHVGDPTAYRLLPGENVLPMVLPDGEHGPRGGFAYKHLWVTAYDRDERYAAGDYPNQHPGGAGLPSYVQADRPLDGEDVVVWYAFGAHHVVRPEDWPVMPTSHLGFRLKPSGFFDANPALDMPRSAAAACHHHA